MKSYKILLLLLVVNLAISSCSEKPITKTSGLESITADDLKHHLQILASDEFNGRNTPSTELKIASRYLAEHAAKFGLVPVYPNGSFFQALPLKISVISENNTSIQVNSSSGRQSFRFPKDFGIGDANVATGTIRGNLVFLGMGFKSPNKDWDDYSNLNFKGKIVVILDANLPDTHPLKKPELSTALRTRADTLIKHGAMAVLKIISPDREMFFQQTDIQFINPVKATVLNGKEKLELKTNLLLNDLQLRHAMAANVLGIPVEQIQAMFTKLNNGDPIVGFESKNTISISISVDKGIGKSQNVMALIEGNDPELRDEYVVFGAHYDHIGISEGGIYNGANDNGSGTVGLLELAQAMSESNPSRSIIFVWFTGEEKGLWGSEFFVKNPPVPLKKISACINLDVISGHDLSKITVSGGDQISSQFEKLMRSISTAQLPVALDFIDENPRLASFFFTRSDHYPFLKNGIPAVWFGAHSDTQDHIHKTTDIPSNINYEKMANITRFAYLLGMEVANHKALMPLDKIEEITERGPHNLNFDWIQHRKNIEN